MAKANTVTVACKLPHGLILRLFDMLDHDEPVMGGGMRTVKKAVPRLETVTLKGYAVPFGKMPDVPVAGGYALTTGVDAEFWDAWLEQNKTTDLVKNNLVFAAERQDTAQGRAREQDEIRNGLEPLDPEKPMKGVQPATKAA